MAATTNLYDTTNYQNNINNMYDAAQKNKEKAINAAVTAGRTAYQNQIGSADSSYKALRNEAYASDQTAQRTLRERMANLGMSAGGGKSMTLDSQRQSALLNRMGEISRQKQQYLDDLRTNISKLQTQGSADIASAAAENEAQRNQALMADFYNTRTYNYQQKRDQTSDGQWKKQYDMQQQSQNYQQAWALYKKRKIGRNQFELMTGIKLK